MTQIYCDGTYLENNPTWHEEHSSWKARQIQKIIEKNDKAEKLIVEEKTMIKVGQKAPDFVAPAYHKGKFVEVKLSDYLGKWVVLCFYPGDFTFV